LGRTDLQSGAQIKHEIIQKFQIEPSATWHQNVTVEDPYVFHYTFGHEYTKDGIPLIGVGEWSLDKRRWTSVWPPPHLTPPPKCAGEATHVLTCASSLHHRTHFPHNVACKVALSP
jgi:hypothetical protein